MKSEDEIQRAHDMLSGALTNDFFEVQFKTTEEHAAMVGALDVLCWMLGHAHNPTFENNMLKLEAMLFSKGFVFRKPGDPPPKIVSDI